MDYLTLIKQPISSELDTFINLFNDSLSHADGLLGQVLEHIRKRAGKRMRPMLILLMAKNFGEVTEVTQRATVGLELLVGDYILSTALLNVSLTGDQAIITYLAQLGRTLSNGEILQLTNIRNQEISEEVYYQVIRQKTAALFEACAGMGAMSTGAGREDIEAARKFGQNLGIIFQIRDDIFDYYDSEAIGKPTGNDMAEGKLTLPVIHALHTTGDEEMRALAMKVKEGSGTKGEIDELVAFAKRNGGIEYAERRMGDFHAECMEFIGSHVTDGAIGEALKAYLNFVIERKS